MSDVTPSTRFDPETTTRPTPALLRYYTIVSMLTLILFPFVFIPSYFKYQSLRYRFDDEGVGMSWGILFKKEIYLTYRRIQDIHVSRGIIQRQLGLATVSVQTASGSSGAEMSIEGMEDPEGLRDYLYSRMRGSQPTARISTPDTDDSSDEHTESTAPSPSADGDEALALLNDILQEVRRLKPSTGEANHDRA